MRVIAGFPEIEVIIHVLQTSMKTFGQLTILFYIESKIIALFGLNS